ncbi:MAG: glycine--tRNA ligase subunit beta [Candidatus Atribacteria bacterium]|nr:glycine--tRNA ligase subunit beta [Candidatus Atribacteria bacterium]
MNKRNFLLEIGVEELPSSLIPSIFEETKSHFLEKFRETRLHFEDLYLVGTPRRITLIAKGLQEHQEPLIVEVKGPAAKVGFSPDGKVLQPALAFARAQGIDPQDLFIKVTEKGKYIFGKKVRDGQPTKEVLTQICPVILRSLNFPRSMFWGEGDYRFVRPIRWLVALFGEDEIPLTVAGVTASRFTQGHRFLSKNPHALLKADDYFPVLENLKVIVDQIQRRTMIEQALDREAKKIHGHWLKDEDLINEVTFLVEYPDAALGSFHDKYLQLPACVLTTVMKHHQKYFACVDDEGNLLSRFLVVLNRPASECEKIIHGNERVLKARLEDALFFFTEDQKKNLEQRTESLKGIVFQEGLGTMWEKTQRLKFLVARLGACFPGNEGSLNHLDRAALLSKADLTCEMVKELPELQGLMGKVYAQLKGENEEVAIAIKEQYLPSPGQENYPETFIGSILSLADKMDNIVSSFTLGRVPSGSTDPFGLRRQAQGIINILLNRRWYSDLSQWIGWNIFILKEQGFLSSNSSVIDDVIQFIMSRFRYYLLENGMNYSIVNAVLSVSYNDIYDIYLRINALQKLFDNKRKFFEDVITGFCRANNITKNFQGSPLVDKNFFEEEVEYQLFNTLQSIEKEFYPAIQRGDYIYACESFSVIIPVLNHFFDEVLVMTESESVRNNRLSLLKKIVELWQPIADLSQIVIEEESR